MFISMSLPYGVQKERKEKKLQDKSCLTSFSDDRTLTEDKLCTQLQEKKPSFTSKIKNDFQTISFFIFQYDDQ